MKSSGICKTQINDSAVLNAFAGFLPVLLCLYLSRLQSGLNMASMVGQCVRLSVTVSGNFH